MKEIKVEFPGLKKLLGELMEKSKKRDKGKPTEKLKGHVFEIVDKMIIKKARAEAKKLLSLGNKKELGDFLYYYHSGIENIPCLVLDSIKDRLHKENKLPKRIGKNFGLESKNEKGK